MTGRDKNAEDQERAKYLPRVVKFQSILLLSFRMLFVTRRRKKNCHFYS